MTIDQKLIDKANRIARDGEDAETVIAHALANLAWERQEVAAVQQSIDEYNAGRRRPYEEFAAEFFAELGLTRER